MIKNGIYALYRGKEYELLDDMEGNKVLITDDKNLIDCTFIDQCNSGIYSKIVDLSDLEEVYSITTYGIIDKEKVKIRKQQERGFVVGTNDCKLAENLNFKRVDKYWYEGFVLNNNIKIIEEKKIIK